MVFSSGVFLFIFLPVVLIAHTLIRNNTARNGLLIAASLIFYAYGEPIYIAMLIGSVAVNYIFGSILQKRKYKPVLIIAVLANILLLVVFKYAGFLIEIINIIPGVALPVPELIMPIGISFFTFQAISYIIDTYRSEEAEKTSFFKVLLYISLFPQLIAGPIVKYNTIRNQISDRKVTADGMAAGIRRFIIGLSKKMLISNAVGYAADTVFAMQTADIGTPLAWLGAISYTLQIYFDFSGYSDMALGLGKMLGFDFPENFNYPYSAAGIREFWRRWHMSLTGWFREYLYIPLGGNRKGKARQIFNSMIVFICTGIWHGANFTFVVWGLFHGILVSIETAFKKHADNGKLKPVKWLYTILIVIIGFVIFRADNITYAWEYIVRMFAMDFAGGSGQIFVSMFTPVFIVTIIAACIASFPVVPSIKNKIAGSKSEQYIHVASYTITLGLYFLCIMNLAADSYNPFIYFRF